MASESILLKSEANKLGIPGYRTMSLDVLKAAIKSAKTGTSSPTKGKTASKNGSTITKGKTSRVKGKGKTRTAPAKSTTRKSAPKKATAAKGTAKRQPVKRGTAKRSTAKAKTATKARATRSRKNVPLRVDIDRTQIDWRMESGVGRIGKRSEVMAALRKHKGNYDKAFDSLVHRAKAFYPAKTKAEAEKMLRWLINRVAYDYVMATEQHTPGERAGYGQSDAAQNIRRREQREAARKEAAKATRGSRKVKSSGRKTKATAKRKTASSRKR